MVTLLVLTASLPSFLPSHLLPTFLISAPAPSSLHPTAQRQHSLPPIGAEEACSQLTCGLEAGKELLWLLLLGLLGSKPDLATTRNWSNSSSAQFQL